MPLRVQSLATFIDEDRWDHHGGISGIGDHAWYGLRNIVCVSQNLAEEEWNKYRFSSGILVLLKPGEAGPILDDDEPVVLVPDVRGGSSYGTPGPSAAKRPRPDSAKRGMAGADTDGLGLKQSYYKKVTLVESKFKGTPFEKVKALLGSKTGVAGEQGGKMLGSYLYSISLSPMLRQELFSTDESVDDFLAAQLQVPTPGRIALIRTPSVHTFWLSHCVCRHTTAGHGRSR